MMMHMTFYWGKEVTLLFDFWKTETWVDYLLTLLACLLFSSFYQYMEHSRLRLFAAANTAVNRSSSADTTPLLVRCTAKLGAGAGGGFAIRMAGAALFGLNSVIGYMLMLAVMSFNVGVLLAVVLGLSLGHLFFRSPPSPSDLVLVVDSPCACA